jgi:DNA-binding beta-propeller fold protein YncE
MGQTLKLGAVTLGAFALVVAMASTARAQCNPPCGTFLTKWGSPGSGDGQFSYLSGVAVDGSGHVFVTDFGNARIQKFDNNGTFLTKWGSYGAGNGQFTNPTGVAVDGSGNVFVSDWDIQCQEWAGCQTIMARIQKFTNTGTFLTTWGSPGSGDGQFFQPTGVAVDGSGNVYVADSGYNRVQKFTNIGSFILEWRGFTFPFALAVDGNGHVFVTDTSNNLTSTPARIVECTNTGTFLTTWGSPGSGDGQFANGGPHGVAVDGSGHVFVADGHNNRIQKFACQ